MLAKSELNLLRELRNANADAFFDSRPITSAEQEIWWNRYVDNRQVSFYSIWVNDVTPVGFLGTRYRKTLQVGHVVFGLIEIGNLLLAPAYRGYGIMHRAIEAVRTSYPSNTFWIAHVKPNNNASLRVFERQGFWRLRDDGR